MADDIVQVIQDAREDATSLSEFIYYPANTMIERRLAPSIHTLNYYLDYLHGLELIYSQPTGTVTVNGEEIKTVRQAVNDAIDSAILDEYQTQLETSLNEEITRATNAEASISTDLNSEIQRSTNKDNELESELDAVKFDTGIAVSGTDGRVERTQSQKNKDSESFKGFGAVGDGLTDDTNAINTALASGLNIVSTTGDYLYTGDIDTLYDAKPSGSGFIVYDGYKYPVKPESRVNHLWQGEFAAWQMANALKLSAVQRLQIPAGVTHARQGYYNNSLVSHVNGSYNKDAIRITRITGDSNTASHNMVINLNQEETKALVGNKCTLVYNTNKSDTWTGSEITVKVQASNEMLQPILKDNGEFTSGNTLLADNSHVPILRPKSTPYHITFNVPADTVQLSISIDIPYTGTADSEDWVEFENISLAVSDFYFDSIQSDTHSLSNKARTRYQSSYPDGVPRGAALEQGSIQLIAAVNSPTYADIAQVVFNPPMMSTPWFTFQSPTSGTEFRMLNKRSLANVNGMAYDLSNKGVVVTNNGAITVGDRLLFNWTAEVLF